MLAAQISIVHSKLPHSTKEKETQWMDAQLCTIC